jgi:hypothetical protein
VASITIRDTAVDGQLARPGRASWAFDGSIRARIEPFGGVDVEIARAAQCSCAAR